MSKYEWARFSRILDLSSLGAPFGPRWEYDAKRAVRIAKELNANAVRYGALGKYAQYRTSLTPMHPDLGDRDPFAETIELCHQDGIKVIAYIRVADPLPIDWVSALVWSPLE